MTTLTTASPTSTNIAWTAGHGVAAAQGTFGGGSFGVSASFDGGSTFIPLADETGTPVVLTAAGMISFQLPSCLLSASLSGSTGGSIQFTIRPSEA